MVIPEEISAHDKYAPAMEILTQAEADEYFEALVQHSLSFGHLTCLESAEYERRMLGYFAGYYSDETRARVEKLFKCEHPFFGAIAEER